MNDNVFTFDPKKLQASKLSVKNVPAELSKAKTTITGGQELIDSMKTAQERLTASHVVAGSEALLRERLDSEIDLLSELKKTLQEKEYRDPDVFYRILGPAAKTANNAAIRFEIGQVLGVHHMFYLSNLPANPENDDMGLIDNRALSQGMDVINSVQNTQNSDAAWLAIMRVAVVPLLLSDQINLVTYSASVVPQRIQEQAPAQAVQAEQAEI